MLLCFACGPGNEAINVPQPTWDTPFQNVILTDSFSLEFLYTDGLLIGNL